MAEVLEFTEEQTAELRKLGAAQKEAMDQVSARSSGLLQIAADGTANDTDLAITNLAEATIALGKANGSLWKFLRKAHPKLKEGEWKFNLHNWSAELVPAPPPPPDVSPETPTPAA